MSQFPEGLAVSDHEYQNIFEAANDGLILFDIEKEMVVEANTAACEMHGYSRQEFIGLASSTFMPEESQDLFREYARKAEADGAFESLAIHIHKDGSPFHVEVRTSMVNHRNRLCLLSAIRDVSRRIKMEKILKREMEARMREQATLLSISHTLASTLELQPGLILEQLNEIIEYNHAELFSFVGSNLITLAMRGTPQLERSTPIRVPLTSENMAVLFKNGHRPICIADVWSDTPEAQFLRALLVDDAIVLLENMHSWLWVPLAVKGRIIGGVGVAHEKPNHFSSHYIDLALSVANQAAITMVNGELNENAQTLAVLEERQRLARNLHDAVNQSLFSAGLIAEVLPRLWDQDQALARQSLEDLRMLTRGAMAEMRALLAELRPSTLIDADLGDLVRLLGSAFTGRTNVPVNIKVSGKGSLPAEAQVAIYRVGQEALNNIAKHAVASLVEIHLKHDESAVELKIRDNGKGFDIERTVSGHYGLSMMRERAEAVGARLSITSQPGAGTELLIRWAKPLSEEAL